MRKMNFFPRLAMINLARNGRFYLPYLLTIMGTAAAYYIAVTLAGARDLPEMTRYAYLAVFMEIGTFIIALFAVIFLTYTNSFLMKRRRRELGLYNVLGLDKRNLGLVLGLETLYTAVAGIGGGILLGLLLQKLVTLLLYQIMDMSVYFGFYVSWRAIGLTALLFSLILLGNLLLNLGRMHMQNPMEMLREGSAGEREPKTKVFTAILGVLCLGGGYTIAVTTQSAIQALGLYFIAVFLVIIGTYCLFSAVSIAVLKALRKNKRYYYQTNHFIGVSGMLYRMKRNAVGLSNICILSTMVLVMISGTLSLYVGSADALKATFPGNLAVGVEYDPTAPDALDSEMLSTRLTKAIQANGFAGETVYTYRWLGLWAVADGSRYEIQTEYRDGGCQLCLLSAAEYAKISGGTPAKGGEEITLALPDGNTMAVTGALLTERMPAVGGAFGSTVEPRWMVVQDEATIDAIYGAQQAALGSQAEFMHWYGFWEVNGTQEQQIALPEKLETETDFAGTGGWERLEVASLAAYSQDYYSMNGGFFFLGLFLGILFIMAAVLIIYYKQVSEGYEDRERYQIMQKVGMEQRTVRHSINSQILVVFFAPLLVAGVHIAFDYGLMTQLLSLFSLYDMRLTLWCTVGTFLVFAAVYALVYWATARVYYRIVRA